MHTKEFSFYLICLEQVHVQAHVMKAFIILIRLLKLQTLPSVQLGRNGCFLCHLPSDETPLCLKPVDGEVSE